MATDYRVLVLDENSWQQNVKSRITAATLGGLTPSKGDRYLLTDGGNINKIGYCSNATGPVWTYLTPLEGWVCWVNDENLYYYYNGSSWSVSDCHIQNTDVKIVKNDTNVTISDMGGGDEQIMFQQNNAEIMRIRSGKLGILNNDPQEALHVTGNVRLSGNITDGTNVSSPANIKDAIDKKHSINTDTLFVKNDGTVNPTNLLSNGDFENWSAGTAVAPDGWTLGGAGASVAREASIIKLGTYSTKLTRVGADCVMYQEFHSSRGINYWKNRTVTFGCWVYATVADRARIGLEGASGTYSSYHTGNSTWQFLTVTKTFSSSETTIDVACVITTGNTSAYFDGAMCVEGESIFAFCEKPLSVDKLSDTFKNINPTNLLSNGDFENWSAGTAVAPDGWTLGGAGASVAREASIIKLGTYSTKLTRAGADCYVYQRIDLSKSFTYFSGRKITVGCWVYATVADRARLLLGDFSTYSVVSSYHTGNSTWQFLTVTGTVSATSSPAVLNIALLIEGGNTSAYFDGAMCVEGESIFAYGPNSPEYLEGTFTVGLTCGTSGTITLNNDYKTGRFIKMGKLVFANVDILVSSVSSPVGSIIMTGLPFASEGYHAVSIWANGLAAAATTQISAWINNGTTILIYKFAAGNIANLAADIQGGSQFRITVVYKVP